MRCVCHRPRCGAGVGPRRGSECVTHTLVVGGTGMLTGVCRQLAARQHAVSVMARDERRLDALDRSVRAAGGVMHPISVDYSDSRQLASAIRAAKRELGPIDLAVCWIHATAPRALALVAAEVRRRLIHIIGSASTDPLQLALRDPPLLPAGAGYQAVVLGYQSDAGSPRWLTDEEIVEGVLSAVDSCERRITIVGTVDPWSGRP